MYYQDIGNIAFNALLSYHSNKTESKQGPKAYLRSFLSKKASSNATEPCVANYYRGLLDRAAANPISFSLESNLSRTYQDMLAVDEKLKTLEGVSLKSRLDNLAKALKGKGYASLMNYQDSPESLPSVTHAILVWGQEYTKFNQEGNLQETMKIRVRTEDLFEFAQEAFNNGVLLSMVARDGANFEFTLEPGNNCPGAAFPVVDREVFEKRQTEFSNYTNLQKERLVYSNRAKSATKSKRK